ncbi:mavicyanin-like [Chenopodium quinoa]|uniref:Phytocyanin domain-containing protein n=1 Tax=Chenopodium quinoa TaxID=63459 RepID=A0A803MXK2_CHEQI|nr:mavicyanin-like [Chenopodium quinoa]
MGNSSKLSLIFLCIFSLLIFHGVCTEFEVGESLTKGWEVPPLKRPQVYNDWAQKNRFKVNDTLHFKYKKDSVMVVSDAEYSKCGSSQPLFFANTGDTTFVLDRPGLFYFLSGVAGHCQRGQKMIIKVLDVESPPAPGDDQQSGDDTAAPDTDKKSGATHNNNNKIGFVGFIFMLIVGFNFI